MSSQRRGSAKWQAALRARVERTLNRVAEAPVRVEPEALVHELQLHQLELELQNEALREAQTELESACETQRQLADRYRDLYELAPVGYMDLDPLGAVLEVNRAAAQLLGQPREALLGRFLSDFVIPSDQDIWFLTRRDVPGLVDGRVCQLRMERPGASPRCVEVWARGVPGSEPGSRLQLGLLDVTDREEARRARRAAAARATLAEETARRKLAEELHDGVGQLLALACIRISELSDVDDLGAARGLALEISRMLDQAQGRVASLSSQLSPGLLYDLGLVEAGRWLAEQMCLHYSVRVDLVEVDGVSEVARGLDDVTRSTLFRALRELLMNVIRHARTPTARVRLRCAGSSFVIEVTDSGCGFESKLAARGFGLTSLGERLELIGGRLEIYSLPGRGTRAVVTVPLMTGGLRDPAPPGGGEKEGEGEGV